MDDDERRHAVGGSLVDVGAGGEQGLHRFEIAGHRGMEQRREPAFGPRRFAVALLRQLRDRNRLSFVEQLRLAVFLRPVGAPLHLARRVRVAGAGLPAHLRAGVDVGAGLEELARYVRVALRGGKHQRGVTGLGLRVGIRTVRGEQLHRRCAAGAGRQHHRRFARRPGGVGLVRPP